MDFGGCPRYQKGSRAVCLVSLGQADFGVQVVDMDPVKIPCPYAPDCLWVSIPLDFDKALILVEQHVKFKHPEAAEQTSTVSIREAFEN